MTLKVTNGCCRSGNRPNIRNFLKLFQQRKYDFDQSLIFKISDIKYILSPSK